MRKLVLFLALICVMPEACPAREFQLWNLLKTDFTINKQWDFEVHFAARFRDGGTQAFLYYGEFNLVRHLPDGWKIEPGYRHTYRRVEPGHWKSDPTGLFAVTKMHTWNCLKFYHRSRVEYRSENGDWVFRQKITCEPQLTLGRLQLRPIFYEEVRFHEGRGFSQNRLFAGLKKKVLSDGELRAGYLSREIRNGRDWTGSDILYLTAGWSF